MTGMDAPSSSAGQVVVRIVGGLLGGAAALLYLLLAAMVLRSVLDTDPAVDPHGYGVVFGTVLSIPAGLVAIGLLPLVLPAPKRARGYRIALICWLALTAILVAVLFAVS